MTAPKRGRPTLPRNRQEYEAAPALQPQALASYRRRLLRSSGWGRCRYWPDFATCDQCLTTHGDTGRHRLYPFDPVVIDSLQLDDLTGARRRSQETEGQREITWGGRGELFAMAS